MRTQQSKSIPRAAYSPAEFAAACGRHPTWTYRLMYSGKLHAITELGRILIPASELERILRLAQPYDPKPKLTRERKQHTAPSANTGPGCYPTDAVSITEGYADDAAPIAGGYSDDDQSVPANEQDTETA